MFVENRIQPVRSAKRKHVKSNTISLCCINTNVRLVPKRKTQWLCKVPIYVSTCQSQKKKKKIQKSKCEVNLALLKIIKPFGMFRRVKINRVTDVSKDHSTFIKVFKPKKWNSKNRQRNFRFGECYRNMFRTYRIIRLISLMILMILKGRNMFP